MEAKQGIGHPNQGALVRFLVGWIRRGSCSGSRFLIRCFLIRQPPKIAAGARRAAASSANKLPSREIDDFLGHFPRAGGLHKCRKWPLSFSVTGKFTLSAEILCFHHIWWPG